MVLERKTKICEGAVPPAFECPAGERRMENRTTQQLSELQKDRATQHKPSSQLFPLNCIGNSVMSSVYGFMRELENTCEHTTQIR